MLTILLKCLVAIIVGAIAITGLRFLELDAKLMAFARWLIILFIVLFVLLTLWHGRGVFGL